MNKILSFDCSSDHTTSAANGNHSVLASPWARGLFRQIQQQVTSSCRRDTVYPIEEQKVSTRGLELKEKQKQLQHQNVEYIHTKAARFTKWEQLCSNPEYVPKVDDRVAIVGAGPAGLHMAFKLKELGFKNVTLLEKEVRKAGKSFTQYQYEPDVPQEFGTCYTIPFKYRELRRIAKKMNYTRFEEIPVPERHVFSDYAQRDPISQDEWLVSAKKKRYPFLKSLPMICSKLLIFADMVKYNQLYFRLFRKDVEQIIKETDMTLKEYLVKNKLEDLVPLISLANTIQGYGFIDNLPALYGLWWNSPAEIRGFMGAGLRILDSPASILRHGFVDYWEHLYEYCRPQIKDGFEIKRIERTDDGVEITDAQSKRHQFDFVILTSNLKDALQFLDARGEEKEILEALTERSNLITTLFSCKHTDDPVPLSSWTDTLKPKNQERLMTVRNSRKVFYPEDVGHRERDYLISYQYREKARANTTEYQNQLKHHLVNDLTEAGYEEVEIHEQHVWPYFQRWSQESLNKGYPVKLMQKQGSLRTWYAGASTLFESVHDCMEYNLVLTSMIERAEAKHCTPE